MHAEEQTITCTGCGFASPPDMAYCGLCGGLLVLGAAAAASTTATAERRQLTLLFCELAGSQQLAASLDGEAYRTALSRFQALASLAVQRHSGHVAQLLGDGLLAYFGYPVAHEEDARRALLAALGISAALAAKEASGSGPALVPRIGLHTGLVVAGDVGAGARIEALAVGETPNIAARVLGLAAPGEILASEATVSGAAGFFEVESLGPRTLKGVARQVTVHRVLAESEVRSQFEVRRSRGLSPLVGRVRERERLHAAFADVKEGRGRTVMLSGEAGVGKSRLHQDLVESIEPALADRLTLRCSAHHVATALNPVIAALGTAAGLRPTQGPEMRLTRLEGACASWGRDPATAIPLLAPLLGIPLGPHAPPALNPMQRKAATFDLLAGIVLGAASRGALLLTVEDLHWADASTLDLLDLVRSRLSGLPVLLVVTFRPSFVPRWKEEEAGTSWLRLARLTQEEVEQLVLSVTGGVPLAREVLRELAKRTDGVPLFVEELTRMLTESEHLRLVGGRWELKAGLPASALPLTLQDSLTARLDRIPLGKEVVQVGAVLGRRFDYRLVRAVTGLTDQDLGARLEAAVSAEVLAARGVMPETTYTFRHALIRDAAYETLLKAKRRELHARAGQVLEAEFPESADAEPEVLAHHYEVAGHASPAITWSQRAGRKAGGLWAHVEAVHHFQRAVALLPAVPDEGRDGLELGLRSEMGASLLATRGYAGEEVEANYDRAAELCRTLPEPPLNIRFGVWSVHLVRGDVEETTALLGPMEERLRVTQDPIEKLILTNQISNWLYYRGRFAEARPMLEAASASYHPDNHAALARASAGSGALYSPLFLSHLHWWMGEPDLAWERMEWCLATAESLGDPFALAEALIYHGALAWSSRLPAEAEATATRCIDLAKEHGLLWPEAVSLICRGWARTMAGSLEQGRAEIDQGLAFLDAMKAGLLLPYFRSALTEWYLAAGRHEEGLAHVEGLVALAENALDLLYNAEIHRLHGELLLAARQDQAGAAACFHRALAVADGQENHALCLRAAVSLGRLLHQQGRHAEAREAVAPRLARIRSSRTFEDLEHARAILAHDGDHTTHDAGGEA